MRPQDVFDRIVASHREIREILAALEEGSAAAMEPAFARLGPLLEEHFAYEERLGGFHDRIADLPPEGARIADGFLAEHGALLHEYVHALHVLRNGSDGVALVRDFAAHLSDHERRESEWAALEVRR